MNPLALLPRYRRFWTYKRNVPKLRRGERLDFKRHRGYHIIPPPAPPPTPPPLALPAIDLSRVRNLLVWATVTNDAISEALKLDRRWRHLFSADPKYRPSAEQIARVIAAGRDVNAWCDCRTTLPHEAKQMVADHGLSDWYGQGESADEFDVAVDGGAKAVIVNLSALHPLSDKDPRRDQLARISSGDVIVTNENYRNKNPGGLPDWRQAAAVGSNTGAVYGSQSEGAVYLPVATQLRYGWFGYFDGWYLEGFEAEDWAALRSLG